MAYAVLDQVILSGASFVMNLLLIRWLSADEFGRFALIFAGFILLSGLYNSLILEPLSVLGPAVENTEMSSYLGQVLCAHFLISAALSLFPLIAYPVISNQSAGIVGTVMIVASPFVLLSWVFRRMCYVLRKPEAAAIGSAIHLLVLLTLLLLVEGWGRTSSWSSFVIMAIAGLSGGAMMAWLLPIPPSFCLNRRFVAELKTTLSLHWSIGKWVILQTLFTVGSTLSPMIVAALTIGIAASGLLRALELVIQPMSQVMVAIGGLLALPLLSRDYAKNDWDRANHKAQTLSVVLVGLTSAYLILLIVLREPIAQFLGQDANLPSDWLIPLYGIVPVVGAMGTGASIALRAAKEVRYYPLSTGIPGLVGLCSAPLFTVWWGVLGSVLSILLNTLVLTCLTLVLFHRWLLEPTRLRLADPSPKRAS